MIGLCFLLYNLHTGLTIMERFIGFFTNWTLLLQIASIMITIFAAMSPELFGEGGSMILRATHHVLYSLCIVSNFVVVIVYWTVLHDFALKKFAGPKASRSR